MRASPGRRAAPACPARMDGWRLLRLQLNSPSTPATPPSSDRRRNKAWATVQSTRVVTPPFTWNIDGNLAYRHRDYAAVAIGVGPVYTGDLVCLAIPGQVLEIVDPANQIAKVDVVGVRRNINVSLLADGDEEAAPGDWVLIHVGFALSKVDEDEARATLRLLERMGADYEQELEELKASVIE
jgi:hydrogenase expression/formation protein HypC